MSAEQDYADAVSRILMQQGHSRALGTLGSGKAWAGFAQQLGELPGQLYGQYQQMKGFEQDQAARDQQMAIRDSDSKLRQQQAGFEAEDRQRAAEIRRQATDALRGVQGGPAPTSPNALDRNSAGQPSPKAINEASDRAYGQIKSGNTDAVFSQLPPEARVLAEKWYQDFSAGDQARQAQAQAEGKRAAQMIRALNYDPVVAGTAIRLLGDAFPGAKDALGHTTDPKQLRALVDYYATIGDKPPDPFTLNPGDTRFSGSGQPIASAPRTPSELADDDIKQRQLAGMSPTGISASQQADDVRQAAAAAEARRHNLATEGQAAQTHTDARGDVTNLTPEGLDAAAMMFAKTGQLPALGMGDKTTRKAIINRAAAMVPGLDVASAKADFGANETSLKAMQKQRDAISAFEQTASKNIDIFLDTAGKVVDTGSPFLNTPVRAVTGKMLGSANQAQYDAARQVAVNEVAKIITNPNLSGQLSDAARKEVEGFNPQNATLKQSVAVMRLLKRDMANRAGSMDDQIAAIKARIGKAGTPAAAPSGTGIKILKIERVPDAR